MESDFDILHLVGVKYRAADELSLLQTTLMNCSNISNDIPVVFAIARAQKNLNELSDITLEQTQIEKSKPQLPTFDDYMSAKFRYAYCENLWPLVEILQ